MRKLLILAVRGYQVASRHSFRRRAGIIPAVRRMPSRPSRSTARCAVAGWPPDASPAAIRSAPAATTLSP